MREGDKVAIQGNPDPAQRGLIMDRIEDSIMLMQLHRTEDGNNELQAQKTNPVHKPIKIDEEPQNLEDCRYRRRGDDRDT